MWHHIGNDRPDFALPTTAEQESVWDYPRPPRLEACDRWVRVFADDILIAESKHCLRLLETASPPTFYLPPSAVKQALLVPCEQRSHCEWKGQATYWALPESEDRAVVAWSYAQPHPRYAALQHFFSFYPGRICCYVDDQRVRPQPGHFYGGWVTDEIVGPYKGEAGTGHW